MIAVVIYWPMFDDVYCVGNKILTVYLEKVNPFCFEFRYTKIQYCEVLERHWPFAVFCCLKEECIRCFVYCA